MSGLEVKQLSKAYRGRAVVSDVSFSVLRGQSIGLLGPNGAGKTTTFGLMIGLVQPDSGDVLLDGQSMAGLPVYRRARMGLSYLPQEPSVFRKLTVRENLGLVLDSLRLTKAEKESRLNQLLSEFGIAHLAESKGFMLSGGERRRLEVARVLALEPAFVLLDEPFSGVDPIAVAEIRRIIRMLVKKDIGVVITDHSVRETLGSVDSAYLMRDGRIWLHGTPEEVSQNSEARKHYLGEDFRL